MSIERSYVQRDPRRLAAVCASLLALTGLLAVAEAAPPSAKGAGGAASQSGTWPPVPYPSGARVDAAREFAASAPGTVSFAVMDANRGIRGLDEDRQFSSASVSKSLLLAAALRMAHSQHQRLDDATRSTLESMITISDNDAASAIYAQVGDAGMEEAAERAGMQNFAVTPGYWGGAQVTAADLCRFFFRLDRNLVGPDAAYAKSLLANITSAQRWGIPAAAPHRWDVFFKGGWRPAGTTENSGSVTHQAALLEDRTGRDVSIAVLTDQSPGSTSYATLEGITSRLLEDPPSATVWPAP